MIEPYNLDTNNNLNQMLGNMMENAFFLIILFAVWIFVSLIIWLFGSRIKSEKVIKFGMKNLIISALIQIFILAIPVVITFFSSIGKIKNVLNYYVLYKSSCHSSYFFYK